jgi:hypothetical protein
MKCDFDLNSSNQVHQYFDLEVNLAQKREIQRIIYGVARSDWVFFSDSRCTVFVPFI